ncbi:phosphoenolpyruvate--protein phosphotransferase [Mesomycoplasma neurolyticum]|uniref:Phosphoenolpyruvate-protein phosphotransferase n=1 Tax=Mesomycoplasma neurolyticum TaxID=2120 RepID=A0A449A688_9BACT|nr:phosphoenolpyruvate--protein phosphotransferase [Mesomycoplasma neurolyticum]VEU59800.1 Phosphoenolpyruvate-protein phosphotransferase [Mesomycoplasma neurolyticum]
MSRIIKGIAASKGIAVAKIFKIEDENNEVEKALELVDLIENKEEEIVKLEKAIEKSILQIEQIKEKASKTLSNEELEIFDAHILIANDPSLIDEMKNLINEKGLHSAHAVFQVKEFHRKMFQNFDDEYMKERAADIHDVWNRVIKNLLNIEIIDLSAIDHEVVIVAHDLTPSETAQLNKKYVRGFLTNIGGKTSHSAIMARTLEIPAILGLENITKLVNNVDVVAINGTTGELVINPTEKEIEAFQQKYFEYENYKKELEKFRDKTTITKDRHKVIIAANIGSPKDSDAAIKFGAEAIGLFRSEFLYMDSKDWPTEEEQFENYAKVLKDMNNKQVVVRTLDIGGDKTLEYFQFPYEMNPFLGYRAIRLSLDKQNVFRDQLRALIRASVYGNLAIMFPMISTVDEFKKAKEIFDDVKQELINEGLILHNKIEVGMMVETPAAAVLTEQFCRYADFVSIGTNDLMQYSMAADRMNEKVSYLYQPLNPSILRLIKMTIDGAHKAGKWVGMCGEMAGDISAIPLLLGMGLDEFSMSASSILEARKLISEINFKDAHILMHKAINAENEVEVKKLMKEFFQK